MKVRRVVVGTAGYTTPIVLRPRPTMTPDAQLLAIVDGRLDDIWLVGSINAMPGTVMVRGSAIQVAGILELDMTDAAADWLRRCEAAEVLS